MTVNHELPMREIRARLAEVVDGAEYRDETTVITRNGHPVAAVVPLRTVSFPGGEAPVLAVGRQALIDQILIEDAGVLDLLK